MNVQFPLPAVATVAVPSRPAALVLPVLLSISLVHMINDIIQSLLPATYPLFKESLGLSFTQIGIVAFVFQSGASMLQPLVGIVTDRRPLPYTVAFGMCFTVLGVLMLANVGSYMALVAAAGMVGVGSAIFHPEASRVARMTSGGRHGLTQSVFQVGGNGGQAFGPLLAAFIVVPGGQGSVIWFALPGLIAVAILLAIGRWYKRHQHARSRVAIVANGPPPLPRATVVMAICVLLMLMFTKYFYLASLNTYYTFYLIEHFGVPLQTAQIFLFVFLGAVAVGTLLGGPVGDRIGRKYVIWVSILGVLPFTVALPHANLFWTVTLTIPIGLIIASAFSAILVFAQELMPTRIGLMAGLFYGLGFGMAGIGAAVLGQVADRAGITAVYQMVAWLPAFGILTALLPNIERPRHAA